MPIMPIDNVRNASRVLPVQAVQPVQRSQAVGPRFQLPLDNGRPRPDNRRKLSAGRSVVVREDGFVRRYGVLPDGTRILISEEAEHESHPFPLPHHEAPRIIEADSEIKHDPEGSLKASGRKLKSLLNEGRS
ncbi:hypothetical protein CDO73_01400 [Saccharibacillus sp. O23]|uniref:hypothetical protein n=1 Tax=Saccharibacillus sp. O23 TaxID=2009338 RepID=UPI000B4E6671|nr:hypothetical protein [Saccharibacillus sp. O23]OWR33189.1 hypothetical protein CDO73_01400 [Saccharibacillus sp. O23]